MQLFRFLVFSLLPALCFCAWKPQPVDTSKPLVVLDAGHGGYDEGARVHSCLEKRLTLTTVLMTKKYLTSMGYRVILTRSRDVYLSLPRRVAIANKNSGAVFVSIHYNSCPSADAKGIEIFYFDNKEKGRSLASKKLGDYVLHCVLDETRAPSRGVKMGKFHVIRETDMPAILVEGGFMTNKDERTQLKDRAYLERIASGVAFGVDNYLKSVHGAS